MKEAEPDRLLRSPELLCPPRRVPVSDMKWKPQPTELKRRHFMHREIHEQPDAILETLGEWVEDLDRLIVTVGGDHLVF